MSGLDKPDQVREARSPGRTSVPTVEPPAAQQPERRLEQRHPEDGLRRPDDPARGGRLFVARYLMTARTLTFATGPGGMPNTPSPKSWRRRLRRTSACVVVKPQESQGAAVALFGQNKADLAIVRSDTKIPGRARAVAILEHSLLMLVGAPKNAKPKSLSALKGKKLALIGDDPRDASLLRTIFAFYDISASNQLDIQRPRTGRACSKLAALPLSSIWSANPKSPPTNSCRTGR